MIGTFVNVGAVIVGSLLGNLMGNRLPERVRSTVVAGFGLFTLGYGLQMFIKTQNALVVVGAILIGSLLGEWWQIDQRLAQLGVWLEGKFNNNGGDQQSSSRFIKGFLTASLIFCVGPMAILGSIQDGLTGDSSILIVKAILDRIRRTGICLHSGSRRHFLCGVIAGLPGRHYLIGCSNAVNRFNSDDNRNVRRRWSHPCCPDH